jgi:uncharacterized protein (TIGR02466 family)
MLHHAFTTPIFRAEAQFPPAQMAELRDYLLELRASSAGEEKSNRGGWHSSGNLFGPEHRSFPFLQEAVTQAVFSYIGEAFGFRGDIRMALTAWAVINRAGDTNVPHNHAQNLVSGVLYLQVPDGMRGGEIVFQDPRFNLNAYRTEAMRELNLVAPWEQTTLAIAPKTGDLLVFPSWLMHYVQAFSAPDPEALRIVISFNAAV